MIIEHQQHVVQPVHVVEEQHAQHGLRRTFQHQQGSVIRTVDGGVTAAPASYPVNRPSGAYPVNGSYNGRKVLDVQYNQISGCIALPSYPDFCLASDKPAQQGSCRYPLSIPAA